MFKIKLCNKCDVSHCENCPKCFGFGHYITEDGMYVPVAAGEAEYYRNGKIPKYELYSCEYCNGTIWGYKE